MATAKKISQIKKQLIENLPTIINNVMQTVPICDIDRDQIGWLLKQLLFVVDQDGEFKQFAIKKWIQRHLRIFPYVGQWTAIITELKEAVYHFLVNNCPSESLLAEWPEYDRTFTLALIETCSYGPIETAQSRTDVAKQMLRLGDQLRLLDENKTRFIKVAAHELKTPLTLLEGYANMLRENIDNEKTADQALLEMYLGGFDGGTDRLRRIIDDMIEMSLINSGKVEIQQQPVNLALIIEKAVREIEREFFARRVDLEIEAVPENVHIFGDPEKLTKALKKVIGNGLKFTPDGGRVFIEPSSFRKRLPDGAFSGHVIIRVQDNGIGIDPTKLTNIFKTFGGTNNVEHHSSSNTGFMGYGPGLGLPIAKGIIEAHGGKIWATSPGHDSRECPGSTFMIKLPLYDSSQKHLPLL